MIQVSGVGMQYPLPMRYREMLTKPFGPVKTKRALAGVELSIAPGERVAFLGPNGAGKTTLLKLIAGLLLPSEGRITVGGFDTVGANAEARKLVSLVLNEERSYYWRLTGRENLEFFGVLENLRGPGLKRRISEVVELTRLGDYVDREVGGYSSGMRQKLALARGLLADPEILILDEPTRALDPLASAEMVEFLMVLHRQLDKCLLIATHRLEEAEALCTRLCVLAGGGLRADRPLAEVQGRYSNLLDFYTEGVNP